MQINYSLVISVLICIAILSTEIKHKGKITTLIFSMFLLQAQPTAVGQDFDAYASAFETIEFNEEYPYVFTQSILTAEIGYFWYMAPFRVLTSNFNVFLVLNFLFLVGLAGIVFDKMSMSVKDKLTILLFSMPVVCPLIFYWSPRSGPPLIFILYTIYFLDKKKWYIALPIAFVASIVHSQYIPILAVIFFINMISRFKKNLLLVSTIFSAIMLLFLKNGVEIINKFPFPEIFKVAAEKMHYIEDLGENGGLRLAGVLIVILSILILKYINEINQKYIEIVLKISIPFSILANIIFVSDSHVAGRIARFSDFSIIIIGGSYFVSQFKSKYKIDLKAYAAIFLMIIYNNIYFIELV